MSQELKRELMQCQVALADCRLEKDEVVNELTKLHEQFANCSTAEYSRECELKIMALNEQLETMSGLFAHEREARLLESDSRIRAIEAEKAKENEFRLQIERLQKELLEKCDEIGVMHENVNEANEEKERFRTAAEQSFALQEAAAKREEALMNEVQEEEKKRKQVESRCVELLQVKMGLERDVMRLRNEVTALMEAEKEAREEVKEKEKMCVVARKRCDATVRQIHEDRKQTVMQMAIRWKGEKEENEAREKELKGEIGNLEKQKEEEKQKGLIRLEEERREREKEVRELKEEIQRMQREKDDCIANVKKENESMIRQLKEKQASMLMAREKALKTQYEQDTAMQLSRQKEEMEREAENLRSVLEMKLVKAKEAALAEQTRVFQSELVKCQRESEEKEMEMEKRLVSEKEEMEKRLVSEKEEMEKQRMNEKEDLKKLERENEEKREVLENEVKRLKQRVDDLVEAIRAKDEAMRHLMEKQTEDSVGAKEMEKENQTDELENRLKAIENEKKRIEEELDAVRKEHEDSMKRKQRMYV